MNICLINGSPRPKGGVSGRILAALAQNLGTEHHYTRYDAAAGTSAGFIEALCGSEVIVMAFPLYADGIPAHLLRLLTAAETSISGAAKGAVLYVAVNNGFYEASQNVLALSMARLFGEKAGLVWGQGIAIGGGGMLESIPLTSPLMVSIRIALSKLADSIRSKSTVESLLTQPSIPRRFYFMGANMNWRKLAKQNGVSLKK